MPQLGTPCLCALCVRRYGCTGTDAECVGPPTRKYKYRCSSTPLVAALASSKLRLGIAEFLMTVRILRIRAAFRQSDRTVDDRTALDPIGSDLPELRGDQGRTVTLGHTRRRRHPQRQNPAGAGSVRVCLRLRFMYDDSNQVRPPRGRAVIMLKALCDKADHASHSGLATDVEPV